VSGFCCVAFLKKVSVLEMGEKENFLLAVLELLKEDFTFGTFIHWKAKNNRFRFSLSLFTFFTLRLFPEKLKSDFFAFFTFTFAFEK